MAQNNWQQTLESLLTRSSANTKGSGSDLTALLLGKSAAAERPAEAGTGGNESALTASELPSAGGNLRGPIISLSERLNELIRASQSQVRTLEDNTAALARSSLSRAVDTMKSAAGTLGGFSALSTGPTALPLISGIAKLFGGSKPEPPRVTPYSWPASLRVEAGIGGGANGGVSHDANGTPRLDAKSSAAPAPQINIHVQAMDSRSFLDHSGEIARAVRAAMLESHALSDVLSEY